MLQIYRSISWKLRSMGTNTNCSSTAINTTARGRRCKGTRDSGAPRAHRRAAAGVLAGYARAPLSQFSVTVAVVGMRGAACACQQRISLGLVVALLCPVVQARQRQSQPRCLSGTPLPARSGPPRRLTLELDNWAHDRGSEDLARVRLKGVIRQHRTMLVRQGVPAEAVAAHLLFLKGPQRS
jgi:hypothetical protein